MIMYSLRELSLEAKVAVGSGVVFFSMLISRTLISESVDMDTRAALYRAQFLLFINSVMLIASLYVWRRMTGNLCRVRRVSQRLLRCWKMLVLLFLVLSHSSYVTMFYLVAEEPHWVAMLSFTCLGSYIILLFFLFLFSCVEQCHRLVTRRAAVSDTSTADSGSRAKVALALALTLVLTALGLLNAARPPVVVRVEVPVDKLSPSFDNLKLVLLSDIHLGPTVGKSRLEMVVAMVNELQPDIVVIVGDLADSQVSRLKSVAEPLRRMGSRLGTFFVTGNHDYYTADVDSWLGYLRTLNVMPLHNANARISASEQSKEWFCLAGVDDLEARLFKYPGHGMDLTRALSGCDPDRAIILLAHQPLAAKRALQERPEISLVLSGHTHAGQIFPLSIMAYLVNPFFSGLYRVGNRSFVYVTPGTVYYGIPMRIGSTAQITEIILKTP
ncbi:transmembrane protein with metallophosphoesterase domain [Amia ocellicauda]|uniref:transmembrane protein with metallophosphoesterase domain n=1 Tax=Amia ocellicauda TaxID=2972642 RepID=UPI0034648FB2